MLNIGIPKESVDRESRVAMTPTIAKQLINKGFKITLEADAIEKLQKHYKNNANEIETFE